MENFSAKCDRGFIYYRHVSVPSSLYYFMKVFGMTRKPNRPNEMWPCCLLTTVIKATSLPRMIINSTQSILFSYSFQVSLEKNCLVFKTAAALLPYKNDFYEKYVETRTHTLTHTHT